MVFNRMKEEHGDGDCGCNDDSFEKRLKFPLLFFD